MNRIFFNQNTNSESLPEVFINLNITGDGRIRLRSTPLRYEYLEDVTVSGTCRSSDNSRGIYSYKILTGTKDLNAYITADDVNWRSSIGGSTPTSIDSISSATVSPRKSSIASYTARILEL